MYLLMMNYYLTMMKQMCLVPKPMLVKADI